MLQKYALEKIISFWGEGEVHQRHPPEQEDTSQDILPTTKKFPSWVCSVVSMVQEVGM
jgi:hypothetical protein